MNLEMFIGEKVKKKRSCLKTLVCFAKLDVNSTKYLVNVAKNNGIDKEEFLKMVKRSEKIDIGKVDVYTSLDYIYDLIVSVNNIYINELELENNIKAVNVLANKIGLLGCETKNTIVVRLCFQAITRGKDKEYVIEELKSFLLI
jgi:hypothetical protein